MGDINKLYDNIKQLAGGKIEVGTVEQFTKALGNQDTAKKVYGNLSTVLTKDQIGSENDFLSFVQPSGVLRAPKQNFGIVPSIKMDQEDETLSKPLPTQEANQVIYGQVPGTTKIGDVSVLPIGKDFQQKASQTEQPEASIPTNSVNSDLKPLRIETIVDQPEQNGQYMDILGSKPQEKGFMSTGAGDAIEKFESGAIDVFGNTFGAINNFPSMLLGLPTPEKTEVQIAANEVAEYVRRKADRYKGKDFEQLWKEGDKLGAAGDIALAGAESLPASLLAMFGGGAGLLTTGASSMTQQYDKLRDNKTMSEDSKRINSMLNGTIQVASEFLGDVPIGNMLKGIATKTSAKAVGEAVGQGMKGWIGQAVKKAGLLFPPVGEGLEEVAAQIGTNVTDYITGARKDWNPLDGAFKAGVYGMGAGAGFSAVGGGMQIAQSAESKKNFKQADTSITALLSRSGFTSQEAEEIKQSILSTELKDRDAVLSTVISSIPNAIDEAGEVNQDVLGVISNYVNSSDILKQTSGRFDNQVQTEKERQDKESNDIVQAEKVKAEQQLVDLSNKTTGTIQTVKLKDNSEIQISNGTPIFKEDGTFDAEKTGIITHNPKDENGNPVLNEDGTPKILVVDPNSILSLVTETALPQAAEEAGAQIDQVVAEKEKNDFYPATWEDYPTESGTWRISVNEVTGKLEKQEIEVSKTLKDENGQPVVYDIDDPINITDEEYSQLSGKPIPNTNQVGENGQSVSSTEPIVSTEPSTDLPQSTPTYPTDKNGNVDFKSMTDEQIFNHTKETKGEDAAHSLIGRQITRLQGQIQDNTRATNKHNEETNKLLAKAKTMQDEVAIQAKQDAKEVSLKEEYTALNSKLGELQSLLPKVKVPAPVEAPKVVTTRPEILQLQKEQSQANLDTSSEAFPPIIDTSNEVQETPVVEESSVTKPKETPFQKRAKELGEYIDMKDYILRIIAGGQKLKWKGGLESEFRGSNAERLQRRNYIDETNGLTPTELAHQIWNDYGENGNNGEIPGVSNMSDGEILDEVHEVLRTVKSNSDALSQAEERRTIGTYDPTPEEAQIIDAFDDEMFAAVLGITNFTPEQITTLNEQLSGWSEYIQYEQNSINPGATPTSESNSTERNAGSEEGSRAEEMKFNGAIVLEKFRDLMSNKPVIVYRGLSKSGKNFYKGDKELDYTYYTLDKSAAAKYGTVSEYIFNESGDSSIKIYSGSLFEKFGNLDASIEDSKVREELRKEGYSAVIGKRHELIILDKSIIKPTEQKGIKENSSVSSPKNGSIVTYKGKQYTINGITTDGRFVDLESDGKIIHEDVNVKDLSIDNLENNTNFVENKDNESNISSNKPSTSSSSEVKRPISSTERIQTVSSEKRNASNEINKDNETGNTKTDRRAQPTSGESDGGIAKIALLTGATDESGKPSVQSAQPSKSEQEYLIKSYAKENGLWLDENSIPDNSESKYPSGKEADVYLSKDGKTVIKVVNYQIYSDTPANFINDRVILYNSLFKETPYSLDGFTENGKGLQFVLSQPFIPGELLQNLVTNVPSMIEQQKRVSDYMKDKLGMTSNGLDSYTDGDITIQDIHLKNVIEGLDGNLYFIDVIPSEKLSNLETLQQSNEAKLSETNNEQPNNQKITKTENVESLPKSKPSVKTSKQKSSKFLDTLTGGEYSKSEEVAQIKQEAEITDTDSKIQNIETKPKITSKADKIEDVGVKIGGAKKDLFKEYADKIANVTDEDITRLPLSKSFPRPNFSQLIEDGKMTQETAIFLNYFYDEIPSKPQKTYKLKQWVEKVRGALDTFNSVMEKTPERDLMQDFIDKMNTDRWTQDHAFRAESYRAIKKATNFPNSEVATGKLSLYKGKTETGVNYYSVKTPVGDRARLTGRFNTIDEAITKLIEMSKESAGKPKQIEFSVYSSRKTGEYFITPKGKGDVVLQNGFKTSDEAFKYREENAQELNDRFNAIKELPDERRISNNPRTGFDYRQGKDISPEKFGTEFGFRGVEFGNWVNQEERQLHINEAYDALMDLSTVIEVSPKALSLNGELGFAFGSRGGGKYAAYYETDKVVINLTKTKGAGCLAHEWFHALDNYLLRSVGNKSSYATDGGGLTKDGKTALRSELNDSFRSLMKVIRSTGFYTRSNKIDRAKGSKYWGTAVELGARGFEDFVMNKLSHSNIKNDYLVNFKSLSEFIDRVKGDISDISEKYPYPTLEESPKINDAFQNLFDTIQEGESGALFQTKKPLTESTPEEVSQLTERLLSTGLAKEVKMVTPEEMMAVLEGNEQLHAVYHGSPHSFDQFDLDHIGTGEGAQAYGHGLYFTDKKEIAENYAKNLGNGKLKQQYRGQDVIPQSSLDSAAGIINDYQQRYNTIPKAIKRAEELKAYVDESNSKMLKYWDEVIDWLRHSKISDFKRVPSKVLYSVELHEGKQPSEYDYLRWEKPVSTEIKEKIFKQLKDESIRLHDMGSIKKFWDGESSDFESGDNMYGLLSNLLGSQKEASEFLLRSGIDGIQYPANFTTGKANETEFNYVVFDPSAITIKDKVQFMRKPDGTIYGFVKDGVVYLNSEKPNLNTPIHEFGHLFTPIIKTEHPEFYQKGVELIKESPYYDQVKNNPNYSNLDEDGIIDEAMNQAIGDKGEKVVEKGLFDRLKEWIKGVWERIGAKFGIKNLTSEQIQDLTLNDWTDIVNSELLSGNKFTSKLDAEKTPTINIDGIERSTTNSLGKQIHGTEEGVRNFWKWFGDSKVVDESGRPLVVYHGTVLDKVQKPFDEFNIGELGVHFGNLEQANKRANRFEMIKSIDHGTTPYIFDVYLKIENPVYSYSDTRDWSDGFELERVLHKSGSLSNDESESIGWNMDQEYIRQELIDLGFDGIKYKNSFEGDGNSYIVFSNDQIKSANGNNGELNSDNEDIRFQALDTKPQPPVFTSADTLVDQARKMRDHEETLQRWQERQIGNLATQNGENLSPATISKLNKDINSVTSKLWEGWADAALPIKEFQKFLEKNGVPISDNDNYYMRLTTVPSRIEYRFNQFKEETMNPFIATLKAIEKNGFTYDDITTYAKLKHGPEYTANILVREYTNKIEAGRAKIEDITGSKDWTTKNQKLDQKIIDFKSTIFDYIEQQGIDYAGRDAIIKRTGESNLYTIKDFEDKNGSLVDDFWKQSKEVSHYALDEEVRGGMRTKESAEVIKGMFDYYVPLKGHREPTAETTWDYSMEHGDFFFSAVKKGKGRTSESDDPFSVMESTVRSAIGAAEQNLQLQSIRRLALKDTTGSMTVSKTWFVKVGEDENGNPEFKVSDEVPFKDTDTNETYNEKVAKFEEKMKDLKSKGEAYQGGSERLKLGLWIKPTNEREHEVIVKSNGESYTIRFHTSPRVPQAINGTNMRFYEGTFGAVLDGLGWATRHMAGFKTLWRPAFILVTNPIRDIHAGLNLAYIDEGAKFTGNVILNFRHAQAALLRRNLNQHWDKNDEGKKFISGKYDKMLNDFMVLGGRTGISKIMELKEIQKSIEKQMKSGKDPIGGVFDFYHAVSDITENQMRVAIYITAIEKGYSSLKATSMAKEATVNFDRKGNGRNGLRELKATYAFINVGFQAIDNLYSKSTKNSETKRRFLISAAANILSAALGVAALNATLSVLFGWEPDKWLEDFAKRSSFARNSNFTIWTPDKLIDIPLGQEFRMYHGLGMDLMMMAHGKVSVMETSMNMIKGLSSQLPYNPIESSLQGSWASAMPDFASPLAELAANKSWLGYGVYKQNQDEAAPGYTKIKTNKKGEPYAPEVMIKFSKWLNEGTGGDAAESGWLGFINPDIADHLLGGYFAGIYEQPLTLLEGALSDKEGSLIKELTPRAILKNTADIQSRDTGLNEKYYKAKDEAEKVDKLIGRAEKAIELLDKNRPDYEAQKEKYQSKIDKLKTDDLYDIQGTQKTISALEKSLDEISPKEQVKTEKEISELKKNIVKINNGEKVDPKNYTEYISEYYGTVKKVEEYKAKRVLGGEKDADLDKISGKLYASPGKMKSIHSVITLLEKDTKKNPSNKEKNEAQIITLIKKL